MLQNDTRPVDATGLDLLAYVLPCYKLLFFPFLPTLTFFDIYWCCSSARTSAVNPLLIFMSTVCMPSQHLSRGCLVLIASRCLQAVGFELEGETQNACEEWLQQYGSCLQERCAYVWFLRAGCCTLTCQRKTEDMGACRLMGCDSEHKGKLHGC